MFLKLRRTGYDRGEQVASGRFLLLVQPAGHPIGEPAPIHALVRFTAMRQLGHFMMGECRAYGHRITLSGSYGNDGLPCTVPQTVYDHAVPVPPDLIEAWNHGGGWNGAGSEASAMRQWAVKTFDV